MRAKTVVGTRHCETASAIHCHKGTRKWVPWKFGTLEGSRLGEEPSREKGLLRPERATVGSVVKASMGLDSTTCTKSELVASTLKE